MQIVITAVGPDNRGLADPIIHHVTGLGANIAEIQMYDHDEECLFAMLLRIELDGGELISLRAGAGRNRPPEAAVDPRLVAGAARRPSAPGHLHHAPPRAGTGFAARDSRPDRSRRSGRDARQPAEMPLRSPSSSASIGI